MRRRPQQSQPRDLPDELYRFEFARWRDPAWDADYAAWGALQWHFANRLWMDARWEWAKAHGRDPVTLPESPDSDPITDYPGPGTPPPGYE